MNAVPFHSRSYYRNDVMLLEDSSFRDLVKFSFLLSIRLILGTRELAVANVAVVENERGYVGAVIDALRNFQAVAGTLMCQERSRLNTGYSSMSDKQGCHLLARGSELRVFLIAGVWLLSGLALMEWDARENRVSAETLVQVSQSR